MFKTSTWTLITIVFTGTSAMAADFSDPTWPCIQRKVERLSVGLMWQYPLAELTLADPTKEAAQDLADRFTLRRVPVEDLAPYIDGFVADHGGNPDLLGHVFASAFDRIATQRRAIIKGIEAFSLKQIALSDRIQTTRTEMTTQMAKDDPDFDKVDLLEEQLDWDERIYSDRQKSLTYVCETPVLMEKRLFAIAQMLAAKADG